MIQTQEQQTAKAQYDQACAEYKRTYDEWKQKRTEELRRLASIKLANSTRAWVEYSNTLPRQQ